MASPQTMGVDTFAQKLGRVLTRTIDKVKKPRATATLMLHVYKDWFVHHVQEQIGKSGDILEPKSIATPRRSNGLGPFFSTLPKELRDMIFADCLTSGYPQFMAASRLMKEEGSDQIWMKCVYVLRYESQSGTRWPGST